MPVGGLATCRPFISRRYTSECLDFCKDILDQVVPFISVFIVVALSRVVRFRRDDRTGTTRG